jgi:CTP:molybdopterin cytidylyltransferase MocA
LRRIAVPDAGEGMAASLRRGAASFAGAEAMMVLPGDMPGIETSDISALIDAFRADPSRPILRACAADGTPGHPVLFPRRFLPEFATLSGDAGAAPVLRAHRDELRLFPLPGRRSVTDLDTPEDWAAWRDGVDPA